MVGSSKTSQDVPLILHAVAVYRWCMTYALTHIYTYTYTYTYTLTHMHMHTQTQTYTHTRMHTHMSYIIVHWEVNDMCTHTRYI